MISEFLPDLVTILELMPYGLEYSILLVWGAGTGVLAYIILWIVVPAAVTTSEKLERGEPVNISNIEKK
jgi:hypothetical protein